MRYAVFLSAGSLHPAIPDTEQDKELRLRLRLSAWLEKQRTEMEREVFSENKRMVTLIFHVLMLYMLEANRSDNMTFQLLGRYDKIMELERMVGGSHTSEPHSIDPSENNTLAR